MDYTRGRFGDVIGGLYCLLLDYTSEFIVAFDLYVGLPVSTEVLI